MFKFKLEALLNQRRYQEELLQKDLAEAKNVLIDEQTKLRGQKDTKRQCVQVLHDKQQTSKSAAYILSFFTYIDRLSNEIEAQQQCVIDAESKFIAVRNDLIEAVKKRKSLEKLKEQQHHAYLQEIQKTERNFMDEVAVNRHIRNQ